jgi:hypothetical protein
LTTNGLNASIAASGERTTKRFPFEVRVATSALDIAELVSLRSSTYSRHNAPGAEFLRVAEMQDGALDAILLIARSKVDGGVIGSVRIQTRSILPLLVESAMSLPSEVSRRAPIELMRGSVRGGPAGRMVSAALAKASFRTSLELGFTHIIVTCREPVDSMYRAYQFDDLLDGRMINLPYSPGAPHKVLCLPVAEAGERWRRRNAPLHEFMIDTYHPDINLDYDVVRDRLKRATHTGVPIEA